MNHQFDELTKGLAQSVTRRGALQKFGVGLAAVLLAALGLEHGASGRDHEPIKGCDHCNPTTNFGCTTAECYNRCNTKCSGGGNSPQRTALFCVAKR